MRTLNLVLVLATVLPAVVPEVLDYTTIYRIRDDNMFHRGVDPPAAEAVTATVEAHLRTNALGRLLQLNNGSSVLEPPVGMPRFRCNPAASNCSWQTTDDNWEVTSDGGVDVYLNYQLRQGNACHKKNGGCQVYCKQRELDVVCSCPPNFHLDTDQKSCTRDYELRYDDLNVILTDSSGSFSSRNYPYEYRGQYRGTWTLVAPPGHRIKLEISRLRVSSNEHLVVYDGSSSSADQLIDFSSIQIDYGRVVYSTGNEMFVSFKASVNGYRWRYRIEYYTELIESPLKSVERSFRSLVRESGTLKSLPFVLEEPRICVSMIYKLSHPTSLIWVSADSGVHGSVNLTLVFTSEVGAWQIGRFTGTLSTDQTGKPTTLSAYITGVGSSVLSVAGCNPYDKDDIYVIHNAVPKELIPLPESTPGTARKVPQEPAPKCFNGGVYLNETKECVCPSGFMGPSCQEACGPNFYGHDCTGMCSGFESGCRRMIFCKEHLPCMCAPGFTGQDCGSDCPAGFYGPSCRLLCGHCNIGTCNSITGECASGCKPGYYPPMCQEVYPTLPEAPTVEHTDSSSALVMVSTSSIVGLGTVKFYQVQYKEKDASDWLQLSPQEPIGGTVIAKLTNLTSGTRHLVRVVLIDEDGNSNQEIGVPHRQFQTSCSVPTSKEYNLKSDNVTSSSFEVSWQFERLNSSWCPIQSFEIVFREQWKEFKHNLTSNKFFFFGLLPGRSYAISVRAVAESGSAPLSAPLVVTTQDQAPGEVTNLHATSKGPGELLVSWNKPRYPGGTIERYRVEYQCVRLLGCYASCSHSAGVLDESAPFVVLTGLHPHAQYRIRVAALAATFGPFKTILAATRHSAADTAPEQSAIPVVRRSNTTLEVQWSPPTNCSWLNGYLYGYKYQLVQKSGLGEQVLLTGVTEHTRANFTKLTPHTQYEVYLFVVTSGGTSATHKLVIPAKTRATAPEHVQNLTVYKRGRRVVGVRWAAPRESYGHIGSFKVTYHLLGDSGPPEEVRVEPIPCVAWPDLYCHTISKLVPDSEYMIAVQARNTEVEIDSVPVSVTAITREGAPSAPRSLRMVQRTQTNLLVEWRLPLMINGVLRSFLVNVEETDSRDPSTCCEYFPIQELPVRTEDHLYQLDVGGLKPSSTYTISVSAKTVTMGPAVNMTVSTAPNSPAIVHPPEIQPKASDDELISVSIHPSEVESGLHGTYLILILPPEDETRPVTLMWDDDVQRQLKTAVNGTFYLVAEFQAEALVGEEEVSLGTGAPKRNGTLGVLQDPVLGPGVYRAGLALVVDYCGAKSVGFASSDSFEVTKCIGAPCLVAPE